MCRHVISSYEFDVIIVLLPTNLCSNVKKFGVVFFLYFFKFLMSIKNKLFQSDPINCRIFILCECSEHFSPKKNDI